MGATPQVEERLKFYDTGEAPRKNIDVMKGVADSLRSVSYFGYFGYLAGTSNRERELINRNVVTP